VLSKRLSSVIYPSPSVQAATLYSRTKFVLFFECWCCAPLLCLFLLNLLSDAPRSVGTTGSSTRQEFLRRGGGLAAAGILVAAGLTSGVALGGRGKGVEMADAAASTTASVEESAASLQKEVGRGEGGRSARYYRCSSPSIAEWMAGRGAVLVANASWCLMSYLGNRGPSWATIMDRTGNGPCFPFFGRGKEGENLVGRGLLRRIVYTQPLGCWAFFLRVVGRFFFGA